MIYTVVNFIFNII